MASNIFYPPGVILEGESCSLWFSLAATLLVLDSWCMKTPMDWLKLKCLGLGREVRSIRLIMFFCSDSS